MFSKKISVSNMPAQQVKKCVLKGQAETVDTLAKRVVLLNRETMELLAARNVEDDKSFEIISPDYGDGKMILLGMDEGGNFNIDAFDRVSLGTNTYDFDSAEWEQVLCNADAYFVEDVIPFTYEPKIIKLEGSVNRFSPLERIYFKEDVAETQENFAEGHFEDQSGNTLDLIESFLKEEVRYKISEDIFKIRQVKDNNTTVLLEKGTGLTERVPVASYSSDLQKSDELCSTGNDVIAFIPTPRTFSIFKDNAPKDFFTSIKTNLQLENPGSEGGKYIYENINPLYFLIEKESVNSYVENIKICLDLSKIPQIFDEITGYTDLSIVFQNSAFLDIEVERFDKENKKGLIWFNIPFLSHTEDTYFALLYPCSKSKIFFTETSCNESLYSENLFVYHMTDIPEGVDACRDSSTNKNHGTPSNMTEGNRSFGLHGAYEYGFTSSEIINAKNILPEKIREGTIEAVFKTTSNKAHILSQDSEIVGNRDVNLSIGKPTGVMNRIDDGYLNFEVNGNQVGETRNIVSTIPVNDNQYHYLGISFYNGVFGMVIDENLNIPVTEYKAFGNAENFLIGTDGTNCFSGVFKEVLISDKFINAEALKLINKSMEDSLIEYSEKERVYRYSKAILIDHTKIDEDLTHFPVAINIGSESGITDSNTSDIFTELGENKYKLSVTDESGAELYVEIEEWDSTNKKGLLWVSRSDFVISRSKDTLLFLYFDSSAPDNAAFVADRGNRPEVYENGLKINSTLKSDYLNTIDNTVNSSYRTSFIEYQGRKCCDLPYNSYVSYFSKAEHKPTDALTISFWCSSDRISQNDYGRFIDCAERSGGPQKGYALWKSPNNTFYFRLNNTGIAANIVTSSLQYVTVVYSMSEKVIQFYINGELISEREYSVPIDYAGCSTLMLGRHKDGSSYSLMDGKIASFKLYNVAKKAAFAKCDYYSQADNLITFSETQYLSTSLEAKFNSEKNINDVPICLKLSGSSGVTGFDARSFLTEASNISAFQNLQKFKIERAFWENNSYAELWLCLSQIVKGENHFSIFQDNQVNPDIGGIGSVQSQEVFKDFKAVYHLNQNPTSIKDSTGNNPNATAYNITSSDVSKDGTVLNGTDKYIDLGQITSEELNQGQVHLSFKTTDTDKPLLTKGSDTFKLSPTGTLDINLNETINSEIIVNNDDCQAAGFSFDRHKTDLIISGVDEFDFGCFGSNGTADLIISGNYLRPNFQGELLDLRMKTTSDYQDKLVAQGKMWKSLLTKELDEPQIIPAFSFDNGSTFKTYLNNAWKSIASNSESIHGVTGDNSWYYIDSADSWIKSSMNNANFALKQAMQFPENMCHVDTIKGLTSAEWTSAGGMSSDGNIQIAFCYNSKIKNLCPSITDVSVDEKIILSCQSYNLEQYSEKITGSRSDWGVRVLEGNTFDISQIEVYSIITNGTWQQCTRGESIPDIVAGMDTIGKEIQFKILAPKNIPETTIINLVPKIY